ncbi:hypothetical protein ZIOFF_001788 [Zingiber officinale]|uniref:Uncharacterized protein n=1 Tax=Zingiber officinale TaxID=94328 RepID=A0A8J5I449_ZINOF|nr:hypothetical protein ZIOFF_001788 [Zingiber officinale]
MGNCCLSPEAIAWEDVKTFPRPHHDHGTSPLANKNHLRQNGGGHSKRMAVVLSGDARALQKTNDEQYRRIQKTEHALQVAEEELLRVQLEATTKSKELSQELATTHWKEHGQPVLDVLLQKVSEKSIQAQQFMEPHFEYSKAKWMFLVSSTEPYVQTVSSKAVEVYHTSKSAMSSHIAKVQEISDPYFQAAKRFSQPYVKQFATITIPHVEKVALLTYFASQKSRMLEKIDMEESASEKEESNEILQVEDFDGA